MAAFNILDPILSLWNAFISALPGIAAAIVLVVFGYLISWVIGFVVREILMRVGFDNWLAKTKLNKAIGGASLSTIIGTLTKWWIFVAFLAPAATFLNLGEISDLLIKLVNWLPNLFIGIAIFLFGLIVADYVADRIVHKKVQGSLLLADIVKWAIIVFIVILALGQIGIKMTFAENAFLIFVSGITLAVSIAIGISLGYALKDEMKKLVKRIKEAR